MSLCILCHLILSNKHFPPQRACHDLYKHLGKPWCVLPSLGGSCHSNLVLASFLSDLQISHLQYSNGFQLLVREGIVFVFDGNVS